MSDSEAPHSESDGTEGAPGIQDPSPSETAGSSSASTPDNSTDVAPTRKARRRPETKPAEETQPTPKAEEEQQPAKAATKLSFIYSQIKSQVVLLLMVIKHSAGFFFFIK